MNDLRKKRQAFIGSLRTLPAYYFLQSAALNYTEALEAELAAARADAAEMAAAIERTKYDPTMEEYLALKTELEAARAELKELQAAIDYCGPAGMRIQFLTTYREHMHMQQARNGKER